MTVELLTLLSAGCATAVNSTTGTPCLPDGKAVLKFYSINPVRISLFLGSFLQNWDANKGYEWVYSFNFDTQKNIQRIRLEIIWHNPVIFERCLYDLIVTRLCRSSLRDWSVKPMQGITSIEDEVTRRATHRPSRLEEGFRKTRLGLKSWTIADSCFDVLKA